MTAGDVTEIRVDTKYSDFIIEQSTHLPTGDLASRVIRLQDDGIRDAFVSLGWLPPHEVAALRRQVEELREIELSEECRGLLMANGSDGTILVCGEFANGREFSQKFRARALRSGEAGKGAPHA